MTCGTRGPSFRKLIYWTVIFDESKKCEEKVQQKRAKKTHGSERVNMLVII